MKKNKSLKIFLFATLALLSIGLVSYKVFAASVTGSTTVIVDGTISPDLKVNLNGSSYVVANQSDGPLMVSYNSAYNLSWDKVDGATSCVLDGYYPADVNGGSVNWRAEGWAGNTHDFKLECTDGTITGTNTVKLSYPPAPTNMKTSCNADGTKVTLTWTNATGYNNL